MNKEELIGKLQMVYIGDINALNEMIGYYDGLKEVIEMVQQENKEQEEYITYWQKETDKRQDKIDKAIEYLINPPKKIWEGHSIDELVKILRGEVDE